MNKTLTPRQQERRARILQTARELINEAGYAGMTTRELATRAKVSATTFFNLYNTKEELLLAALRNQLDGMNTDLDEIQPAHFARLVLIGAHLIDGPRAARLHLVGKRHGVEEFHILMGNRVAQSRRPGGELVDL